MVKKLLGNGKQPGIKQRLRINKPKEKCEDALAASLLGLYTKGRLSAGDVGACSAAVREPSTTLQKLAKAKGKPSKSARSPGAAGTSHSSRTLLRALDKCAVLHPPYLAKIQLWDKDKMESSLGDVAFLPPHETLSALVRDGQEERWCSFDESQQGFKTELHDWAARLDLDLGNKFWTCLALWGDSAPSTHRDGVFLLLFTVLSGAFRDRLWICTFNKHRVCRCGCVGRCTFDGIYRVVAWSARALLAGRFPSLDHEGKPFPESSYRGKLAGKPLGVHGAIIAKCGDWDWFKQSLGLIGWQGEGPTKRVCWLCRAGLQADEYCYDFSLSAAWRQAFEDEGSFWQSVASGTQFCSAIWSIPGFRIAYCRPDFMHCCCLGILQYLQGNVVYELFEFLGGGFNTWQKTCGILENMMRSASRDLRTQPPFHSLTLGMFRNEASQKPRLKLKASEGRHFLPVLRHMLLNHFPLQSPHEHLRFQCVDAMHKVYLELSNWVDGVSAARLGHFGRQHLILYSELAKRTSDDRCWHLYPKHHQFIHVVESARVNPKLEWNYADEDEIGTAADVARGCHPSYICTKLVARYRATFEWGAQAKARERRAEAQRSS
jgi:hypothetical protein